MLQIEPEMNDAEQQTEIGGTDILFDGYITEIFRDDSQDNVDIEENMLDLNLGICNSPPRQIDMEEATMSEIETAVTMSPLKKKKSINKEYISSIV